MNNCWTFNEPVASLSDCHLHCVAFYAILFLVLNNCFKKMCASWLVQKRLVCMTVFIRLTCFVCLWCLCICVSCFYLCVLVDKVQVCMQIKHCEYTLQCLHHVHNNMLLCFCTTVPTVDMWGTGVMVRTLNSRSREPGSSCCCFDSFKSFGNFVHPTLPQFTQLYK